MDNHTRRNVKYIVVGVLLLGVLVLTLGGVWITMTFRTVKQLEEDESRLFAEMESAISNNPEVIAAVGADMQFESINTLTGASGVNTDGSLQMMKRRIYTVSGNGEEVIVNTVARSDGDQWVLESLEVYDEYVKPSTALENDVKRIEEEMASLIMADQDVLALAGEDLEVSQGRGSTRIEFDDLTEALKGTMKRTFNAKGSKGELEVVFSAENDGTKWVITDQKNSK